MTSRPDLLKESRSPRGSPDNNPGSDALGDGFGDAFGDADGLFTSGASNTGPGAGPAVPASPAPRCGGFCEAEDLSL